MVQIVYACLSILAFTYDVQSQYYDFFSAFEPVVHQTLRPFQFEITTKRPKIQSTRHKITFFETEESREREKQRQKEKNALIFSTTAKPIRADKITSQNKGNPQISKDRNVNKSNIRKIERPKDHGNSRLVNDDGKTNIIDYERPEVYEGKRHRGYTDRPYTSRPGVRPIITNGPPITNRPTVDSKPDVDITVSPELIIGPDEDYMSTVDKKRYIEMAERMCDRYKALDMKQVQAIPLVPSPEAVKVNVSTCTPSSVPLVVGGKVVTIQEFPHMALLGWLKIQNDGYSWKCGGSLISERYVLTAAHCAYQDRDNSVVIGAPRAVQLGSSYMGDQNAIIMEVSSVIRHPKYKLPKSYYDLAIVKMSSTVTFSKLIKPACLGIPPPPGEPVIATGWGRTEFGGDQSHELRSVSIPVWDMNECYNALGTSRKIPDGPSSESQICAGEKRGGKDTCQGDSGGPAQIQEGCIWRVVAITSLGRSCGAPQTPALYARVRRAFISAIVFGGQDKNNKPSTTNNNEQTYTQGNQQNVYNKPTTRSTTRNYDSNIYNNDRNQNDYYNQNSRNNNAYTTESNHNKKNELNQNDYSHNRSNNNNAYTTSVYNKNDRNNYYNQNSEYSNNNAYTITGNKPINYKDYGNTDYHSDDNPYYQSDTNAYYNRGRGWWT